MANTAAVASVEVATRSNRVRLTEDAETSSQATRPWGYPVDRHSVSVRHRVRNGSFEDAGMSGTVLIVEDDIRIANWIKVYFERAGFSAEAAHDGESGLALARRADSRSDSPRSDASSSGRRGACAESCVASQTSQ